MAADNARALPVQDVRRSETMLRLYRLYFDQIGHPMAAATLVQAHALADLEDALTRAAGSR